MGGDGWPKRPEAQGGRPIPRQQSPAHIFFSGREAWIAGCAERRGEQLQHGAAVRASRHGRLRGSSPVLGEYMCHRSWLRAVLAEGRNAEDGIGVRCVHSIAYGSQAQRGYACRCCEENRPQEAMMLVATLLRRLCRAIGLLCCRCRAQRFALQRMREAIGHRDVGAKF